MSIIDLVLEELKQILVLRRRQKKDFYYFKYVYAKTQLTNIQFLLQSTRKFIKR